MNRSNLSTLACLSALGLSAVLGACKLDLGGGSGLKALEDKANAALDDGGVPDADASDPGADGGAPNAPNAPTTSSDGGTDGDAGTTANAQPWSATPPAPDALRVTLDVAGDEMCSFELSYVVENPGANPQQYSTLLEKKDASPGSCPDAKGFIYLTQHSYADPAGVVRRHSTDQIIAVAWVERANADGNTPSALRLQQIDWKTGADLHDGIMSVKGAPDQPIPTLRPTSMNLSVGYDVILDGTGAFPGATGAGDTFEATWSNFLGTAPQPAAQADSATQQ
jgi:hypothetical protein